MSNGAEVRQVVQMQPAAAAAKLVDVPVSPIGTFRRPDLSSMGKGAATIAVLAEKGQEFLGKYMQQSIQEDFHNGKILYQQGKTAQELAQQGASKATVAGFQSMNAARLADEEFNASLVEIDTTDKQLSPEQYRAKLNAKFKERMTGDVVLDDYLGQLSEQIDTKLAGAHVKAHTEWKINETVNAGTSLLASKSSLLDNESDRQMLDSILDSPDSPLSTLSPENKKKAVLDAVVLSLSNDSDGLLNHVGGVQGLSSKYNISASEVQAINTAQAHYTQRQQNKFNADYEKEVFGIRNAVRTGKLTYDQGVELAQIAVQKYNKSESSLAKAQGEVESATMERIRSAEADLERAQKEYMKIDAFNQQVQTALSTNSLWALDKKGKAAAFSVAYEDIGNSVVQDVQAGKVSIAEQGQEYAKRVADFVDHVGVIDDNAADKFTAMMSSTNIIAPNGEVQPQAMQSYSQLVSLYKVNPGLAMRHLKSAEAKDMFTMARDFDTDAGDDSAAALLMAAQTMRDDVGAARVNRLVSQKTFNEQLSGTVKTMIEENLPSVIGGTARGSVFSVSDAEVQRAAEDRQYLSTVERMTKTNLIRNPRLTVEQAARQASLDVQQKQAYILGSMVVPKTGTMYDVMGIQAYRSETGAPHEAVYEYMKKNGPDMFGEVFFDDKIFGREDGSMYGYLQSKWMEHGPRKVPLMDITMVEQNGEEHLIVSPLRTDGTIGASKMIRAKDVGNFYKNWRKQNIVVPVDTSNIW